jgi:phosphoribosylformylglycinamidine cyclo-ligase
MRVLKKYGTAVHGMVHITGGGFYENIPRVFPVVKNGKKAFTAVIDKGSWDIPPVFTELIRRGADPETVYSTFNMGIGFILIVKKSAAESVLTCLNTHAGRYAKPGIPDLKAFKIGRIGNADGEIHGQKDIVLFE